MSHLTASLISGPSKGVLSDYIDGSGVDHPLLTDGSFVLTPPPHWAGVITVQYDVSDGILTSPIYTVAVNVSDHAPVANPDGWGVGGSGKRVRADKRVKSGQTGQNDLSP